jgi:hypothetical protein
MAELAFPPNLLVAACGDVLGAQLDILRWMPLGGKFGMGDRQRLLQPFRSLKGGGHGAHPTGIRFFGLL